MLSSLAARCLSSSERSSGARSKRTRSTVWPYFLASSETARKKSIQSSIVCVLPEATKPYDEYSSTAWNW